MSSVITARFWFPSPSGNLAAGGKVGSPVSSWTPMALTEVTMAPQGADASVASMRPYFYTEPMTRREYHHTRVVQTRQSVKWVPCPQQVGSWESDHKMTLLVEGQGEGVLGSWTHNTASGVPTLIKVLTGVASDQRRGRLLEHTWPEGKSVAVTGLDAPHSGPWMSPKWIQALCLSILHMKKTLEGKKGCFENLWICEILVLRNNLTDFLKIWIINSCLETVCRFSLRNNDSW